MAVEKEGHRFKVTLNLSGWQLSFLRVAVMRQERIRRNTMIKQVISGRLRRSEAAIALVEIQEILTELTPPLEEKVGS